MLRGRRLFTEGYGEMKLKAVSGMMLTLLLIGMLTLAFNVPPIVADNGTTGLLNECSTFQNSFLYDWSNNHSFDWNALAEENSSPHSVDDDKWDFNEINEWADFANVDGDSAELVIGVNNGKPNSYANIEGLIGENGGDLVGTVSMGRDTKAFVADIPLVAVSSFVTEVRDAGLSRYIEPNIKVQACFVPNDPNWPTQWGPSKIEADYAWNTTIGDPSVLVAVIDTGIDYYHPDLAANYVALGYDWVNNDTDPIDDDGHGTHCAGIMAAVINNSIGIAGLAQVRIMAEKALNEYGSGYVDDLANAIIHAVDQGADILSNSWGGSFHSELIHDAVEYAQDHGVLVVAAAGNDASSMKNYPAAYDEVVAVTAIDQSDDPASFTSYGKWVDVAAPGVDIYSTFLNNKYKYMNGTSMACPHAAGVAALIWSEFPSLTRDEVRLRLQLTADDLGDPGFDVYYGYGRVNARRAVEPLPSHDLSILNWKRPAYVEPGSSGIVDTTVVNFGSSNEAGITVQLLVNGSVVDSAYISYLESMRSATVSCSWSPTVEGRYYVESYVVPVSGETVVKNNVISAYINVRVGNFIRVPEDCSRIQEAVDLASPGETIKVASGTYYERLSIDTPLKLVGEDRNTTVIDGNGTATVVGVTADNVEVRGFTVQNSGRGLPLGGIVLVGVKNCVVTNNTLINDFEGVLLWQCTGNNSVYGNIGFSNEDAGIGSVFSAGRDTFRNNVMTGGQLGVAIIGWPADPSEYNRENTVSHNMISNSELGILICAYNSTVVNNTITLCSDRGIWLSFSGNTIRDNRVENNERGIVLDSASSNRIFHNDFIRNTVQVQFEGSPSPNTWDDGYPSGGNHWSDYDGVDANQDGIGDTPYVLGENNIDRYPLMHPLMTPFYGPLAKFTYSPKPPSLYMAVTFNASASASGWNGTARVPVVSYTWDFDDGNITTVTNPVIFHVFPAESVYRVNLTVTCDDSVLIEKGCASHSTWQDVRVTAIIYIRADGSVYPLAAPISSVDNVTYTFTGNIYLPIFVERNNIVVDGAGYTVQGRGSGKGIDLTGRSNVTIKNMKIKEFESGIYLSRSLNSNISGNNITDHKYGVWFSDSSYNTVSGNNISANNWAGVVLIDSNNNIIIGNTISANYQTGIHISAIVAYSSYNTVSGNNITNNFWGIFLLAGSYNTVCGNNIANNELGILPGPRCHNNKIYHNNFVNNANPIVLPWSSVDVWDDGYPSGGNYWSDYTGVDVKSGPNQDQPSSDGIGDTPYIIDGNNRDNYPLMYPWGTPSPPSYTLTIHSSPSGVAFTVDNVSRATPWSGTYSENTSVGLIMPEFHTVGDARYYWNQWSDGITSRSRTVTMNTNITLTAHYTGPYYQLTVTSSPITGITFTIDGTPKTTPYTEWLLQGSYILEMPETHNGYVWSHWLEDGNPNRIKTVTMDTNIKLTGVFTRLYDLNEDGIVDMRDISIAARAFGSYPGHPRWNPIADINKDNKVDMRDLATVARNFGKTA